jgi:hypothetical protein
MCCPHRKLRTVTHEAAQVIMNHFQNRIEIYQKW